MPYAVEENLRGMIERKKDRKKDRISGLLLLDTGYLILQLLAKKLFPFAPVVPLALV